MIYVKAVGRVGQKKTDINPTVAAAFRIYRKCLRNLEVKKIKFSYINSVRCDQDNDDSADYESSLP